MENGEKLLLATSRGLAICERVAGGWQLSKRELSESYITSVISPENLILAGTQDGIFRSVDGGDSWLADSEGLSISHTRWLAVHPHDPQRVFAGTEPAGIFLSRDGGVTWLRVRKLKGYETPTGGSCPILQKPVACAASPF